MTFRSIANSCLGDAAQARGLTYQLESPRALAPACQPTSFPAISFNTTYVLSRELSNHLWTNNLTVCLFFPVENALPLIVSFRKTPLILQCLPVCVLSRVQLFETPLAVARQAPLSMGYFRQESWSELPFPTPGIFLSQGSNSHFLHCKWILLLLSYQGSPLSCKEELVAQSCPTLCNPVDCSQTSLSCKVLLKYLLLTESLHSRVHKSLTWSSCSTSTMSLL